MIKCASLAYLHEWVISLYYLQMVSNDTNFMARLDLAIFLPIWAVFAMFFDYFFNKKAKNMVCGNSRFPVK